MPVITLVIALIMGFTPIDNYNAEDGTPENEQTHIIDEDILGL
ncbi:MAG: hypothetical protein NXI25_02190 [bacterium]|jgi:hypothetical protein|nr:hypothetical protein [bacterium]